MRTPILITALVLAPALPARPRPPRVYAPPA
jgi:hypothetical protein